VVRKGQRRRRRRRIWSTYGGSSLDIPAIVWFRYAQIEVNSDCFGSPAISEAEERSARREHDGELGNLPGEFA